MKIADTRNFNRPTQYFISVVLVLVVSTICFISVDIIGYRVVALLLLMVVSVLAMLFDIFPVLLAAVLSALIWNFFFIQPLFTFQIHNAEDLLMFFLYFIIALVNAVLTSKIRNAESEARDKEEKEKTIKLYNTLLNSLSHELRTPISTIIGAVDTLKESKDKLSIIHQIELLTQIERASFRLNEQVENLLNMSRLESGMLKLNADWCDLNEVIFSVIRNISATNCKHEILFYPIENLPFFKLDIGLMKHVLHNIIYNAVQYTPEKSRVLISACYQENNCTVIVQDNGEGFPPNEMQNVFNKFFRLPQSKAGGSGLGLSIARGIVEAHHGVIDLENIEGGGAKFIITIPVEASFINNLKNE